MKSLFFVKIRYIYLIQPFGLGFFTVFFYCCNNSLYHLTALTLFSYK